MGGNTLEEIAATLAANLEIMYFNTSEYVGAIDDPRNVVLDGTFDLQEALSRTFDDWGIKYD